MRHWSVPVVCSISSVASSIANSLLPQNCRLPRSLRCAPLEIVILWPSRLLPQRLRAATP